MKTAFPKASWKGRLLIAALAVLLLSLSLSPAALADTDGTEPKITNQPDQLVLQLGVRWAGVEFELRTDAGVFPVPVAVDESGVLPPSPSLTRSLRRRTPPSPVRIPPHPRPPRSRTGSSEPSRLSHWPYSWSAWLQRWAVWWPCTSSKSAVRPPMTSGMTRTRSCDTDFFLPY